MAYSKLVKTMNGRNYHNDFECKKGIPLQEVNAWTYWQGVGVRNPKIMVVGQDWGSEKAGEKYFKAIDEMIIEGINQDNKVHYFKYIKGKGFRTDINLAEGLKHLGYENVMEERYEDLFFTNLIPGYRKNGKSTGGFKAEWVTEDVRKDFKSLIEILQPKIVICLGKDTFRYATNSMGMENVLGKKKWNEYLDAQENPVEISMGDKSVFFFAMPHLGHFGVVNREKSGQKVENDWKKIGEWMKKIK